MSQHVTRFDRPTNAGINFSYISFAASLLLVGAGIFARPAGHEPSSRWESECLSCLALQRRSAAFTRPAASAPNGRDATTREPRIAIAA